METSTVGKVVVAARIENAQDLTRVKLGLLPAHHVRCVDATDALVDTGATMFALPRRVIARLGLDRVRSRRFRTTAGPVELGIYDVVRLTIQGRECTVEVAEVPDDCPILVGQIPLEALDFVVDPVGQKLIGNPEHGGEHMADLL